VRRRAAAHGLACSEGSAVLQRDLRLAPRRRSPTSPARQGRAVIAIDDEVFDSTRWRATSERAPRRRRLAGSGVTGEIWLHARHRRNHPARTRRSHPSRSRRRARRARWAGTGKTAVALHRAAYLLYTHRMRLAQTGVLVVGPNPVFLRYIEQVLPHSVRPARCLPPCTACFRGPAEAPRSGRGR